MRYQVVRLFATGKEPKLVTIATFANQGDAENYAEAEAKKYGVASGPQFFLVLEGQPLLARLGHQGEEAGPVARPNLR